VRAVAHRWSAQDYATVDSLPYVGPAQATDDRILTATGFDKWGMTNGTAAALLLADLCTGAENAWKDLYSPARLPPLSATVPLAKHNIDSALRMAADWLLPKPSAVPELAEGEGTVVRCGIRPCGVSRTDGVVRQVSAVCTHLGGVVKWNDAERSWDCPLHGSRFAPDGEVLNAPATRALSPVETTEGTRPTATVTADDVRDLLRSDLPGATLILIEGATRVVPGADLGSGEFVAAVVVADRDQLRATANLDLDNPSEDALRELAGRLDATVTHLGG
jgi:nitrite reductase/ring-hydroxylating ferredoxin subunit